MMLKSEKNSGEGQALWNRAKRIIPGGGQLLSKRSERFLPGLWPAYYEKAKGCEVWDLDGKKYYDFAQMGVGSCILGYADDDVDGAVTAAIHKGAMSSLNCPEEVALAEKLVDLHPWAEMARFARTGGEACAVAVRIGRAASGRGKVAFCGYHGWHDWYLAANLADESNLDGQLLPGLEPKGVPRELTGTALPFRYNHLEDLEAIVQRHPEDVGVIIMEPVRGNMPLPGFLEGVRDIATRIGAVLIFDEITSGFRMNLGGIHLRFNVCPDLAVLGKALGNGYAISTVIGRREVMEHAQDTFISSTFWTERIGSAAALATIKKMEQFPVPESLIRYGELISEGWIKLSKKHGLSIEVSGIPPLTHLAFKMNDPLALQTLYAQEMLARGYLLGASVYATYAYTDEIVEAFLSDTDEVFGIIAAAQESGDIRKSLRHDVIQDGFRRLT
ncbi:MAG: aminotransferase class III-fold pyridoxal phosphate-dependent enzyme [Deltaproteobacteria bacterium]|nr:aminotransferase class III-fold pyridoxal phosphate-dependent enzyme [Deltaproteobacteria bacterium]